MGKLLDNNAPFLILALSIHSTLTPPFFFFWFPNPISTVYCAEVANTVSRQSPRNNEGTLLVVKIDW